MIISKEVIIIRNTKQKELILQVLNNDKSHPTIKDIYDQVHALDNKIGQATVYRNVNKLVNVGEVRRLKFDDDSVHYEEYENNHCHFICNSCNRIIDILDDEISIPVDKISSNYNIEIEECEITFHGECDECKNMLLRGNS